MLTHRPEGCRAHFLKLRRHGPNYIAVRTTIRVGTGSQDRTDVTLALHVAATEFFTAGTGYAFEKETRSAEQMAQFYAGLIDSYPLASIEDPLSEDDWDGWVALTTAIGDRVQLVGDDLFVTNPRAAGRRHRAGRGECVAGEGESDRHADRDAGRGRTGATTAVTAP